MIIYQSNKERFIKDLISNEIHEIIEATYKLKTGHRVARNELRSWQESMRFMGAVMDDEEIPGLKSNAARSKFSLFNPLIPPRFLEKLLH